MILQQQHFTLYHNGVLCTVTAEPYLIPSKNGKPLCFNTIVNGKPVGDMHCVDNKWENENITDTELLYKIGCQLDSMY